MMTSRKVLTSTLAALMATQAEAQGLHNSCLKMTDQTLGEMENDQTYFTNESQLTSSQATENMRLYAYKVCTDSAGSLKGL